MSRKARHRVSSSERSSGVCRSTHHPAGVLFYAIVDDRSSPGHPLGDALEVCVRLEDAEQFLADVRQDDPALADHLRIEERELEAGGRH